MNLNQIVARVLRAGRQPARVQSHRRQAAIDIVNEVINEILGYQSEWQFLYKTAEVLSINGINNYALPFNTNNLVMVIYDTADGGSKSELEIFYPGNVNRFSHLTTPLAATCTQLTESPFSQAGYVYPTWGLSEIVGVQTVFDEEVVGRFFKTEMDGEIYRIAEYTDLTHISLDQEFGGKHQAGRVSVYGDTDDEKKIVYGNIHTTNFAEWMIGKYIKINGNGTTTFTIDDVDEDRQKITLNAASVTGEDLIFTIQDNYQIDPPGANILRIFGTPADDNKVISIDYYAFQPPLSSPFDVPLIPYNYHYVIVAAAAEIWLMENPVEGVNPDIHRRRKMDGIQNLINNGDVLQDAEHQMAEPDDARLDGSGIVG